MVRRVYFYSDTEFLNTWLNGCVYRSDSFREMCALRCVLCVAVLPSRWQVVLAQKRPQRSAIWSAAPCTCT